MLLLQHKIYFHKRTENDRNPFDKSDWIGYIDNTNHKHWSSNDHNRYPRFHMVGSPRMTFTVGQILTAPFDNPFQICYNTFNWHICHIHSTLSKDIAHDYSSRCI